MKLKYIQFNEQGFRKLKNFEFDIAKRITVISGHNAIGKSTILGLLANCSAFTSPDHKTYTNKNFESKFQELFYLDIDKDRENQYLVKVGYEFDTNEILNDDDLKEFLDSAKRKRSFAPMKELEPVLDSFFEDGGDSLQEDFFNPVVVDQSILDSKIFVKKFNITKHRERIPKNNFKSHMTKSDTQPPNDTDFINIERLKIVPRSENENLGLRLGITKDAKVVIPTIYLGMSRMTPIGEHQLSALDRKVQTNFDEDDLSFIQENFNKIIHSRFSGKSVHHLKYTHSQKSSLVPDFGYHSFSISLGQDSLTTILTALASFKKLKRELGANYKGGILIIDEVDAGLHPKAQLELIKVLKNQARPGNLNLQILLTTHSLTVIKEILPIGGHETGDKVIYLLDASLPRLMPNATYIKIKDDMLVSRKRLTETNNSDLKVKIYFEDDEAKFFFEKILAYKAINNPKQTFGCNFECVSLKAASSVLLSLYKADDFFKSVILIPDNDVMSEKNTKDLIDSADNICPLPGAVHFNENTKKTDRNPEKILYEFIKENVESLNREFFEKLDVTTAYCETYYLKIKESDRPSREVYKTWFKEYKHEFDTNGLVELWCQRNEDTVNKFIDNLTNKFDTVRRRQDDAVKKQFN